jgi:DNA-3-methyladenine glycosylase
MSVQLLPDSFYLGDDVVAIARRLLGKVLLTRIRGTETSGIITEAEAYAGVTDRASHAYGGRRTARTEVMYAEGGTSYVYLCYGMYSLFNVVTGRKDIPHAVLIRAVRPLAGIPHMERRRKMESHKKNFSSGPGTLTQALGIGYKKHNALPLSGPDIRIEDHGISIPRKHIFSGPRIGVAYAGSDANLPYRFWVNPEYEIITG